MSQGWKVSLPIGNCSDYDLIADTGDRVMRVQVKTSRQRIRDRFGVTLCTRGGNQSWNGIVKRFSPARCDRLYAHVVDGRRWFVPAEHVEGTTAIVLGGPKYAE